MYWKKMNVELSLVYGVSTASKSPALQQAHNYIRQSKLKIGQHFCHFVITGGGGRLHRTKINENFTVKRGIVGFEFRFVITARQCSDVTLHRKYFKCWFSVKNV